MGQWRPNRRLQLTAFGARDRAVFDAISCSASRRRLMRKPFGGTTNPVTNTYRCAINFVTVSVTASRYTPGGLLER